MQKNYVVFLGNFLQISVVLVKLSELRTIVSGKINELIMVKKIFFKNE